MRIPAQQRGGIGRGAGGAGRETAREQGWRGAGDRTGDVQLLLSWLFVNTIFAIHYAHEFYGDGGGKRSGLEFPGTQEPDYGDFVYFAFVIGMTCQVSDVQISERGIRRVALVHALVAFFFNVIVIALSVSIVAGST